MELRQFISKALEDIIGAVEDAQKATPKGCVMPSGLKRTLDLVKHGVSEIQAIDFEVTVKADQRAGSEARLNVVAVVMGGSVKGESGKSGGHAATLRFKIPIRLPSSPWEPENGDQ